MSQLNILLFEDNSDDLESCLRALKKAPEHEYKVNHVTSGQAGLAELKTQLPDCILLDYSLPGNDGLSILKSIKNIHPSMPVIILTGQGNDSLAAQFIKHGAFDYVLKSKITPDSLEDVIKEAISFEKAKRQQNSGQVESEASILIVDDNQDDRERCIRALKKVNHVKYTYYEATGADSLLGTLKSGKKIDCVLLDYSLPGKNGLALLRELRLSHPLLPIIMMTGQGNERIAVESIKEGAFDYVVKSDISSGVLEHTIASSMRTGSLEQKLLEKNTELKESNMLIEAIMRSSSHLLVGTDLQGTVTYMNKAAENTIGYSAEEIIGKSTPGLWHDVDEVVTRAEELSQELGEDIQPGFDVFVRLAERDGSEKRLWTFHRKDKTTFRGYLTATPIVDEQKNAIGYLGVIEDVTESMQKDAELKKSNMLIEAIMRSSAHMIVATDTQGIITYINKAAENALGYSAKDLIGKCSPSMWHDQDEVIARARELSQTLGCSIAPGLETFFTIPREKGYEKREWTFTRRDNSTFVANLTISCIKNDKDEITGYVAVMEDLTEQRKKELAIKDADEFMKLIFEKAPLYLFVKDENFRLIEANSNFRSLYPKDKQDKIIGYTTLEDYDEDAANEFLMHDRKALQDGFSSVTEKIRFPNGEVRTLFTQKVRFQNSNGKQYVLGISHDVTEKEKELKILQEMQHIESNPDLSFSERVEDVLKAASDYFQLSLGLISSVKNEKFEILYSSCEQTRKPGSTFDLSDTCCAQTFESNKPVLIHDTSQDQTTDQSIYQTMKVGAYVGAGLVVNGSLFGTICFTSDKMLPRAFSDRDQAMLELIAQWVGLKLSDFYNNEEKIKLIERLNTSNTELARFAFVCSHDLQEPFRMIRSFTDKLNHHIQDRLEGDDVGKKYFRFVLDGSERAQNLIEGILNYSKIDSSESLHEDVDINHILEDINRNLSTDDTHSSHKLSFESMPIMHGNKTQIHQLFQNLIGNGLKYQEENSAPHVMVNVNDKEGFWEFSIADNGIGIEESKFEKIFDVFQRLHGKSQYKGTGIGLSICKKIVENHGGKIWVESEKGIGTTFYFTIPKALNQEFSHDRDLKVS